MSIRPLRPCCPAKECLLQWRPTNMRNSPHPLALSNTQHVYDVIAHAWAESTKETYGSGLLVYHTFCNRKEVPEDQWAPASPALISTFISTLAGSYVASTITNYVSGVHAWHTIHSLPWALNSDELDALFRASKSLAPTPSKPPREPYTIEAICKIRQHLTLSEPLHAAVFACLTTIFFSTAHTSEFTVNNLNSFNPSIHVTRGHMSVQHDHQGFEITNFHIPQTKAAPLGKDVNWAKQDGPADPQEALTNHFNINNPPFDSYIFAYKVKNSYRPLTRSKFLKTLETA